MARRMYSEEQLGRIINEKVKLYHHHIRLSIDQDFGGDTGIVFLDYISKSAVVANNIHNLEALLRADNGKCISCTGFKAGASGSTIFAVALYWLGTYAESEIKTVTTDNFYDYSMCSDFKYIDDKIEEI